MFNPIAWWRDVKIQHVCNVRGWSRLEYVRNTDVRVNRRATRIRDYYSGYTTVLVYSDTDMDMYHGPRYVEMQDWILDNIRGAYRTDCHRVIPGPTHLYDTFCDIGGSEDRLYFAFELESDATLFALRW